MVAVNFSLFRGAVPRVGKRILPTKFATSARNIKITSGNIEPLAGIALAEDLNRDDAVAMYRYRHAPLNAQPIDYWLSFSADTDVVASPVLNDEKSRIYWTSEDHEPRMSYRDAAISGPGPYPTGFFMLGVPSPAAAPGVKPALLSGTVTTVTKPSGTVVRVAMPSVAGFQPGDQLTFASVGGMTDLNGLRTVVSVDKVLNTIDINLTTAQTYTSGGTWTRTGTAVNRAYAFTFVTALGEESGPSPASSVLSGKQDSYWLIDNLPTTPANSGTAASWVTLPSTGRIRATLDTTFGMQIGTTLTLTYDTVELASPLVEQVRVLAVDHDLSTIEYARLAYPAGTSPTLAWERGAAINAIGMKKRIYRTEGTSALFLFVTEIDIAATSYEDDDVVLTGEVLPTASVEPPPGMLRCMISLPNGCLCGLTDNEVCFSEPYLPYSWPVGNRYSFSGRGVALGSTGNSVIVLTDAYPIMVTGSDPEAMSPSRMESYAPCLSKRGAVDIGGGMLYPSNDGLWLALAGAVQLKTGALYRSTEWAALNPSSFRAEYFDSHYYALHTPEGGTQQILMLDMMDLDSEVVITESGEQLLRNDYDGFLYLLKDGAVYKFDADDTRRYQSEWISAEVQLDQPRNFSVAQVQADWSQIVPPDTSPLEANEALIAAGADAVSGFLAGDEFALVEVAGSRIVPVRETGERRVQFVLYSGDVPVFSKIVNSSRPFKLPKGYKFESFKVAINASVTVYRATVAQSTDELAQASAV